MFPGKGKENYRPTLELIRLEIMTKGERTGRRAGNTPVMNAAILLALWGCPVYIYKAKRRNENGICNVVANHIRYIPVFVFTQMKKPNLPPSKRISIVIIQ